MKIIKKIAILFSLFFLIASCQPAPFKSEPTAPPLQAINPTPPPSEQPTNVGQAILKLTAPISSQVAYDFIEHMCDAKWANNGVVLACPSENTAGSMGAVLRQPMVLI